MLSRSLPAKLSATHLHCFLSVQHAVSLPPSEAVRKLFGRFPLRLACCLAPPSEALRKLFPQFPVRPACCLAPSQRSSPQAICTVSYRSSKLSASYLHGFLSVQHAVSLLPRKLLFPRLSVQHAVSLPPSEPSIQAISTVSFPSSMLYRSLSRSLPAKLSPTSYFHSFLSVQHAVSLPLLPTHVPRVIGVIAEADYTAAIQSWRIPRLNADGTPMDPADRAPTMAEFGQAVLFGRACRVSAGNGETLEDLRARAKAAGTAVSAQAPATASTSRRLKMNSIASQVDDIWHLSRTSCNASEDMRPSSERVSAPTRIKNLRQSRSVPSSAYWHGDHRRLWTSVFLVHMATES